jgi:tRNA pseudouridine38-40 synthase
MQNIKLTIAYDGQNYLGWQKTPIGSTIENVLQNVLEKILQHKVLLQAASRTDAGVHAMGQVVNFLTSKPLTDLSRLIMSLNRLLPKDLTILSAEKMPPSFHPTLDCIGKEYHYFICYGRSQLPPYRFYSWHCPFPLHLEKMQKALPFLIGTHNFAAFCNFKNKVHYHDYVRTIQELTISELGDQRLHIKVRGNHFLYKMVRNLVGTLVHIGKGKIQAEQIPALLQAEKRSEIGVTAPAHGLFLNQIFY